MGNTVVRITVDTLHLQLHFANWPRRVTVTVIFHRQSSPSTVSFSAARGQSTILGDIRIFHRIWRRARGGVQSHVLDIKRSTVISLFRIGLFKLFNL